MRARHSSSCPAVRAMSPFQCTNMHNVQRCQAQLRRNRCEGRPAHAGGCGRKERRCKGRAGAIAGVVVSSGCCVWSAAEYGCFSRQAGVAPESRRRAECGREGFTSTQVQLLDGCGRGSEGGGGNATAAAQTASVRASVSRGAGVVRSRRRELFWALGLVLGHIPRPASPLPQS